MSCSGLEMFDVGVAYICLVEDVGNAVIPKLHETRRSGLRGISVSETRPVLRPATELWGLADCELADWTWGMVGDHPCIGIYIL